MLKSITKTTLATLLILAGSMVTTLLAAETLKPGDAAPDFSMKASDGKVYKLSDFKGKQALVIAWFPKAFTPGCTAECKSFRATGDAIRKFNVAYFTASCDDAETNKKFSDSLTLDFPILCDPERTVSAAFGVLNQERKIASRWTFYISKEGKILHVDREVKAAEHGPAVVTKLKELGVETK